MVLDTREISPDVVRREGGDVILVVSDISTYGEYHIIYTGLRLLLHRANIRHVTTYLMTAYTSLARWICGRIDLARYGNTG